MLIYILLEHEKMHKNHVADVTRAQEGTPPQYIRRKDIYADAA